SGYTLPIFINVSKTLNDSCKENSIDFLDLNREYYMGNENNPTFVVLQFNKIYGVKNVSDYSEILLSSGVILPIAKPTESIFNAGKLFTPSKNTNTIFVKLD